MSQLDFPLQFKRQYGSPLDVDTVFETNTELQNYLSNALRYPGQLVTCKEYEGRIFILNNAMDKWIDISRSIFYPSFTDPFAELTTNSNNEVEVGKTLDLQLNVNFNRGSIFGDNISGEWDEDAFQDYRAGQATNFIINGTNNLSNNQLTLTAHQITEGENVFDATVSYNEGPQPVDSYGDPYLTPYPVGSLSTTKSIFGYRNLFYGFSINDLTSTNIRNLSQQILKPENGFKKTITVPQGSTDVVFAYPAHLNDVTIRYIEGLNAEITSVFDKSVVSVEGANGYASIDYKVYRYTPSMPFQTNVTYEIEIFQENNLFYGISSNETISGELIKSLQNQKSLPEKGDVFEINIPMNSTKVVFAYPASLGDIVSIQYPEAMNVDVKSIFEKQQMDISFSSNNSQLTTYNVYVFNPDVPFEQSVKYKVTI